MDDEIKNLLMRMHGKKAPGKEIKASVCILAIQQKFAGKFAHITDWNSIINMAETLFSELDNTQKNNPSQLTHSPCSSLGTSSSDTSEEDSAINSSDDSSEDIEFDDEYFSHSESSESICEDIKLIPDNELTQAKRLEKLTKFLTQADIAYTSQQRGESDGNFETRILNIFAKHELSSSDLSNRALKHAKTKVELMLLQQEADIDLSKSKRARKGDSGSVEQKPIKRSCSSLVDDEE